MLFFEVDERGCVSQLAKWQGVTAPTGGAVVMAKNYSDAVDIYQRYRSGDTVLKRKSIEIPGYTNPCKNIKKERKQK